MSDKEDHIDKQKLIDYLKGNLSNKESHEIEMLILNNKFYQEAMEGLEMVEGDVIESDIEDLYGKLEERIKPAPLFNWYKTAAVISLLAVASFVIYFSVSTLNDSTKSDTISLNQNKEKEEEFEKEPDVISEKKENTDVESPTQIHEEIIKEETDQEDEAIETDIELSDIPIEKPKNDLPPEETGSEALSPITEDSEPEPEMAMMEEEMEDEIFETEALSGVAGEGISEESFAAPMQEEAARVKSASKRMKSAPVASMAADMDDIALAPQPEIGIEAFYKYAERNLKYPENARASNIQGPVEISFSVPADSIPSNFQVIRSLGNGCDEEAIRLIKEGPKWIPILENGEIIDRKANVEIIFSIK